MTQLEETQAGIIDRERAAISKIVDLYNAAITERDALALQLKAAQDALAAVIAENTANVAAARELLEACWYQFAWETTVKGVLGHNDGGLSVLADVREYLWPGSETHIPVDPAND